MDESEKDIYTYHDNEQIPYNEIEEIVETEDNEYDIPNIVYHQDIINDIFEDDSRYFIEEEEDEEVEAEKFKTARYSIYGRKYARMRKITEVLSMRKLDVIDIGKSIILGTSDKSLNSAAIEKAVKTGISTSPFLGNMSMEHLVHGLMAPSGIDGRYAVLGTSTMWNALKSNTRDLRDSINDGIAVKHSESRFDYIDLRTENLPHPSKQYPIQTVGVFTNANLVYIFRQLRFRTSAKLLNKTKQFLKAYFIIACRPRCMIWRYTLRRSGNSLKKAILNLPQSIINETIEFLLDLTGIGDGKRPFQTINRESPFYKSFGEDPMIRRKRYEESCKLKDSLVDFFRETITDCLNEIREMPFCLNTGQLLSALRGRPQDNSLVVWKDYEACLRREHDLPSEANTIKRTLFEQRLCAALPRNIHRIRQIY